MRRRVKLSRKETYETRTEELLKPIAAEMNVEIYDVDFAKEAGEYYLRAFSIIFVHSLTRKAE